MVADPIALDNGATAHRTAPHPNRTPGVLEHIYVRLHRGSIQLAVVLPAVLPS